MVEGSFARVGELRIDRAVIDDCRDIAEVHVASWREAYVGIVPADYLANLSVAARESSWRESIQKRVLDVLVARVEQRVVGFIAFAAYEFHTARASENERSCRVCERLGFKLDGTLRNERIDPDGKLRNTRVYARACSG